MYDYYLRCKESEHKKLTSLLLGSYTVDHVGNKHNEDGTKLKIGKEDAFHVNIRTSTQIPKDSPLFQWILVDTKGEPITPEFPLRVFL